MATVGRVDDKDQAETAEPAGAAKVSGRRTSPALSRPVTPDAQLAAVIGSEALPRPEVAKRLWNYIKAQGLQDAGNRQMINADDKLRPLFDGKQQVSMFEMTKLVSRHMT